MEIRIPKQNKTNFFVFSIVELTRNNNNKKRGQKYMEVGHTPLNFMADLKLKNPSLNLN